LNIIDNICLPVVYRGDRTKSSMYTEAREIMRKIGIENIEKRKTRELSGGQQQRVAIARTLMQDPDIILGDEITANVDDYTEKTIIDILKNYQNQGKTIVIVSHNHIFEKYASKCFRMNRGGLLE